MKLSTFFVAAIHGLNVFTAKILESPEFKALETAGTPIAEAALTGVLAPEIGPFAPVAAGAAVTGAEKVADLISAHAAAEVAADARAGSASTKS